MPRLPGARVVPTRDGRRWATLDGERCLLTERCPGGHADPAVPGHLDATGAALAWFHTEGQGLAAHDPLPKACHPRLVGALGHPLRR